MTIDCATCTPHTCRLGRTEDAPDDCPMLGPFPAFEDLYATEEARRLAYHAARVEADGYCRWTRVQELVELARRMAYRRIGVVSCPDMAREAGLTAQYLRAHGFEVALPPPGADCDPVGQACRMAEAGTDLNVIAGMCVGHDTLFIRHARAPVTSLVVRDLRLRHNPAGALYTRKGYHRAALSPSADYPPRAAWAPWTDQRLERFAREVRDAAARRSEPPCRLEEIIAFANLAGVRRVGLVFCIGFQEEARELYAVLAAHGFGVSSVCCKTGSVPKERIGITDAEKIRPGQPEMICNALAQAELLERDEVDLVLLMGQCVGHDSATISRLRVPAVCLIAKDRVLAHNTVAALYAFEAQEAPASA